MTEVGACEAMRTQQGGAVHEGAGERQEATESSLSINTHLHNLVFDDPEMIQIVQQFHIVAWLH